MTKEQYLKMCDELSDTTAEAIRAKARTLLKTGALELSSWDNDYRLPKIALCAICKTMSEQWRPFTDNDRKEVDNIEHFI